MTIEKDELKRINFALNESDLQKLDEWRAKQKGLPNRSEALRLIIRHTPLKPVD